MDSVSARDAGLQPQRTALAWSRTSMTLWVNAALVLRSGLQRHHSLLAGLGVLLLLTSVAGLFFAHRRRTWLVRHPSHGAPPHGVMMATLVATLAVALAGWVSVLEHWK